MAFCLRFKGSLSSWANELLLESSALFFEALTVWLLFNPPLFALEPTGCFGIDAESLFLRGRAGGALSRRADLAESPPDPSRAVADLTDSSVAHVVAGNTSSVGIFSPRWRDSFAIFVLRTSIGSSKGDGVGTLDGESVGLVWDAARTVDRGRAGYDSEESCRARLLGVVSTFKIGGERYVPQEFSVFGDRGSVTGGVGRPLAGVRLKDLGRRRLIPNSPSLASLLGMRLGIFLRESLVGLSARFISPVVESSPLEKTAVSPNMRLSFFADFSNLCLSFVPMLLLVGGRVSSDDCWLDDRGEGMRGA